MIITDPIAILYQPNALKPYLFKIFIKNLMANTPTTKAMNIEYSWSIPTGCLIKIEGNWIPLDNYRRFEE